MALLVTGLNHQTASVTLRERMALRDSEKPALLDELRTLDGVDEAVLLSTCNRVEVYASGVEPNAVAGFLARRFDLGAQAEKLYRHAGDEAVRHLFRVVSGLDSMVLGETEIFGQVKEAYAEAQTGGHTARALNKLFQHAFRVGKLIRTTTRIQHGATSVGAAAVELAEKIFGELRSSTVMVLGAGEISRRTVQSLQSRGARSVIVANRSFDRAVELAEEVGGRAVHYDAWPDEVVKTDIVISSTAAPHAIITPDHLRPVMPRRHGRELFLIDIAVPRDIDPACNDIEGVYLFNLDDLESMAAEARAHREREIVRCNDLIDVEIGKLRGDLAR